MSGAIAADRLIIAAAGMCACFGAVVRAPVTAVLMVFEMTHQFSMVPALMLSSLVSQGIARLAGRKNFYDAILEQDGLHIHHPRPTRNTADLQGMKIGSIGTRSPVAVTGFDHDLMRGILRKHPFRAFPVVLSGKAVGVATRAALVYAVEHGTVPKMEKPVVFAPGQLLREIEPALIQSDAGMFLISGKDGAITGLFTLHDLIRAQADITE